MGTADEAHFHDFAASSGPALGRIAYLLTGDRSEAEDLVQTALTRTWGAWSRLNDPANAEAYTRKVLLHLAQRGWTRRRKLPPTIHPLPAGDLADAVVLAQSVRAALRDLPIDQRAVLILRYYEERSEAEIAELLGCSAGTVKSRASRALKRLRASGLLDDEPTVETDNIDSGGWPWRTTVICTTCSTWPPTLPTGRCNSIRLPSSLDRDSVADVAR